MCAMVKCSSLEPFCKLSFEMTLTFASVCPDYYDNSGSGDSFFKGMSSRGPPPMKRGPPVRNGGPPPKRSAPSGPMSRRKCLLSLQSSKRYSSTLKCQEPFWFHGLHRLYRNWHIPSFMPHLVPLKEPRLAACIF